MWTVIGRRFLHAIPLLVAVILVNFIIIHLAPGDPIQVLVGDVPAPPDYVAELRQQFGLDKPLYVQLLSYYKEVVQGNLGYSFYYTQPVLDIILGRMAATIYLMLSTFILASILGVALGVLSSRKAYSLQDNFFTGASLICYSLPVFWLGQMMLVHLSLKLDLFPVSGMVSHRESYTGFRYALDVGYHLVLPVLCLSTRYIALTSRLTRASMLEVMSEDYITTARAKGLDGKRVLIAHALRNALLPVVTMLGLNLGFMLQGSVLVETVFGWPGIGRLMFDSIFMRDYPILMGILLLVSSMVIIANLLTDILYGFLDPRVRYQ
jgi:peptide/nickel transport system permease protein